MTLKQGLFYKSCLPVIGLTPVEQLRTAFVAGGAALRTYRTLTLLGSFLNIQGSRRSSALPDPRLWRQRGDARRRTPT